MSNNTNNFQLRVFYEDTDAGGIVYHANYLKFFERARTEWLRELGFQQTDFLEQKLGLVVRRVEMDNIASAKLDDLLTITSSISQLKRASLVFKQEIINEQQQVLCRAEVQVACVNLTISRPCAIPQAMLGAFERVS
ncbi:tol-pal system-associated acyl-CoA thioesterase [Thalassomonas sp. RHCl1]|uniref:tol-pal system-associated acyl-CoA thioesterase n=1 Tax=Thalassomonas sp. RHCl1 TaxID=2995320 RepID=UPI00248CCFDB|nr:tol-pal system-associated acyl-CoA thioesterase [Thalassomonas sp. RHCl1]